MQVVFLGNYVFWAWSLELKKDNHFWIPEVVIYELFINAITLNKKETEAQCATKHSKAIFNVMMETDIDTVCCVYDLYDVCTNASKAIPYVYFDAQ